MFPLVSVGWLVGLHNNSLMVFKKVGWRVDLSPE